MKVETTDENLFLLACQAIPSLCKQVGVKCSLPSEILPSEMSKAEEKALEQKRTKILQDLLSKHGLSWWDIFDSSGIGHERNILAEAYVANRSKVLDIGCGRGYFSFTAARRAQRVVALDVMDGSQRRGWWRNFLETALHLGVGSKINALRATGSLLPFSSRSFDSAASVHAIRNFSNFDDVKEILKETRRILKPGGLALIAETVGTPRTKGQQNYLAFYALRMKLGWEFPIPTPQQIAAWVEGAEFTDVTVEIRDFGLRYAPVEFPLRNVSGEWGDESVRIGRTWKEYGIEEPPVAIESAKA